MPRKKVTLNIDLQDGFKNDEVVVKINGIAVFRKKNVSTNLVLGLADSFKTKVNTGKAIVEVTIPYKNIKKTEQLNISKEVHLGISIVNNVLDFKTLDKPFAYY